MRTPAGATTSERYVHTARASSAPGLLLGLGLGGFVDGIVLHQVLQWHNMLSARLPPVDMRAMRVNMVFDGYFHAAVWLLTFVGVWALWRAGRRGAVPGARRFAGQLLLGWGVFNLVEGVVDHHVLRLHLVVDLPAYVPWMDWTFLVVAGLGFIALGVALVRERRH